MKETDNRKWEPDPTTQVGWKPKFKMYCPVCRPFRLFFWMKKHIMRIDMGYVFAFKLGDVAKEVKKSLKDYSQRDSFAMDIWSRCLHCGYCTVNGVPLQEDEYQKQFKRIAGQARAAGWGEEDEDLV